MMILCSPDPFAPLATEPTHPAMCEEPDAEPIPLTVRKVSPADIDAGWFTQE